MNEIFPIMAGILVGLLIMRLSARSARLIAATALSVACGVLASVISGEITRSLGFILIDTAQVLVAATLTAALGGAYRSWGMRTRD